MSKGKCVCVCVCVGRSFACLPALPKKKRDRRRKKDTQTLVRLCCCTRIWQKQLRDAALSIILLVDRHAHTQTSTHTKVLTDAPWDNSVAGFSYVILCAYVCVCVCVCVSVWIDVLGLCVHCPSFQKQFTLSLKHQFQILGVNWEALNTDSLLIISLVVCKVAHFALKWININLQGSTWRWFTKCNKNNLPWGFVYLQNPC